MGGTLHVVATPIGNLADISPRTQAVLESVALVAAEDTRHTGRLLSHMGLRKPLLSCHEHNERQRTERLLAELEQGHDVALVSDAGSPLVSDPGYPVVRAVIDAGFEVQAVPGPCAALLALQVSGLPSDTFTFVGFPPKKPGKRVAFWKRALSAPGTVVAYVAARDAVATLEELEELAPQRVEVAVARELTKMHEEVLRGRAVDVAERIRSRVAEGGVWKGEVSLVFHVQPDKNGGLDDEALSRLLEDALGQGEDRRGALRKVRAETGVSRARLYDILERRKESK